MFNPIEYTVLPGAATSTERAPSILVPLPLKELISVLPDLLLYAATPMALSAVEGHVAVLFSVGALQRARPLHPNPSSPSIPSTLICIAVVLRSRTLYVVEPLAAMY